MGNRELLESLTADDLAELILAGYNIDQVTAQEILADLDPRLPARPKPTTMPGPGRPRRI